MRLIGTVLLFALVPSLATAQRPTRADSLKAYNDSIRIVDSTRIANRPCTTMDQFVGLCARADTLYANGKAVAVLRKPGRRKRAPAVDTVYYELIRPPAGRVDTVYVVPQRGSAPAVHVDTVYVDRETGKVVARPAARPAARSPAPDARR